MIPFPIRVLAVASLALLAACGKKPQAEIAPPPPAESRPVVDDSAEREARERAAREAEEARRREAERRRATLEELVFFDYDRAALRDDARQILDQKVGLLREDASIRLTIEGHADERGSTEYNLALGHRRATTVKEYFTGFGLDAGRFQTVSFGEERPLVQGQGEAAWSRNRRAAFRVMGTTTPPQGNHQP